ncbi:response regulator [Blautia difficilis]|uniref:Stage 0 sporulation protein A homolog n=1 Tax=Blautia difficilis TaxID=2763027 RepID=A0ABR7IE67_9FIRM|nr:response regulator [Blautia difficilis]MBC5778318.1 response regulator [Blautia difficilis]
MLKTFLVEDEVVIREMIKKMIPWEQYGFELAGEAADGEMALPLILKSKPDLLITDIKMPFMDGLTLCRLVKKELPDIRIVILSGYDDFNYAKQAISIGVEDYLLKPITKNAFIERLEEIHNRYEHEKTQREYYEKFRLEMQEYEKNASRDFFETLVRADSDLAELYRRADKLNLDIVAEAYNILIFTPDTSEGNYNSYEACSDWEAEVQDKINTYFLNHPVAILFRHQVFSYAILVKGQKDTIEKNTEECVKAIQDIMDQTERRTDWFIAVGKSADRLSMLGHSYRTAVRANSFRYLYDGHILDYQSLEAQKENPSDSRREDSVQLRNVNINALNPAILQKFLSSGLAEEVDDFIRDYFNAIGQEPMGSLVFRNYVVLNVRFSVLSFLKKLGCDDSEISGQEMENIMDETGKTIEAAVAYCGKILKKAIELRDENAGDQNRSVLKLAVDFIDHNYMDEEISLNKAAHVANVSANHFSALFSQNMGQTFTEYLTDLRMSKAKELLRCTAMRSSEIAGEVGYKDAHYFSYLFKKTQGMTPSEYRKMRGEA